MPVFTPSDKSVLPAPEKTDNSIVTNDNKLNIINTARIPLSSIISNVTGSRWNIPRFYSQVLSKNDTPMILDIASNSVVNQYRLIKNQVFKVTDPITPDVDDETGEVTSRGGANVLLKFRPNIGDIMIVGVRDGQDGIFSLTEAKQLSSYEKTTYAVEYVLMGYVEDHPEIVDALDTAVVETYHYYEKYGGVPETLLAKDYQTLVELSEIKTYLDKLMARDFIDIDTNIYYTPGSVKAYDMFIVRFIRATTDISNTTVFRNMYFPSIDNQYSENLETVLDAIVKRSVLTFKTCCKNMSVVPTYLIQSSSLGINAHHNGIEKMIYPIDKSLLGDNTLHNSTPFEAEGEVELPNNELDFYMPNRDGFYIFSEFFYNEDAINMSRFELLVLSVIKKENISDEELARLGLLLTTLPAIYIFYYGPIFALLCKMAMNKL